VSTSRIFGFGKELLHVLDISGEVLTQTMAIESHKQKAVITELVRDINEKLLCIAQSIKVFIYASC
jgi:hypothetical protein